MPNNSPEHLIGMYKFFLEETQRRTSESLRILESSSKRGEPAVMLSVLGADHAIERAQFYANEYEKQKSLLEKNQTVPVEPNKGNIPMTKEQMASWVQRNCKFAAEPWPPIHDMRFISQEEEEKEREERDMRRMNWDLRSAPKAPKGFLGPAAKPVPMNSSTLPIYKDWLSIADPKQIAFVDAVYTMCEKHYEAGGDTVVETMEPEDILSKFKSLKAVKKFCGLHVEQQANARQGEDTDPELERTRKFDAWNNEGNVPKNPEVPI